MEYGEPEIGARHLILCRQVEPNHSDQEAPYTLRGVVQRFRPKSGYPAVLDHPLYAYVEYYGEPGEYDVWFDLIRFVVDEDGDEVDEVEETVFGPFDLNLEADRFVQGRMYVLRTLPLPEPGMYELRLRIGGVEATIITERLFAEG